MTKTIGKRLAVLAGLAASFATNAALWAEKRFRPDTGLLDCGFHHLARPVPAPGLMLIVR